MGLTDRLFGKKKAEDKIDPLADLVLEKLKVGYLVDYDLETWEVTGYCRYQFSGEDDGAEEWELTSGVRQRYLEVADGVWSLSRRLSIGVLDGDVRQHIIEHEDPPERVVFNNIEFHLDASFAGRMFPDGMGSGEDVIRWEFLDDSERSFVSIEQLSETEFAAAAGTIVEEYQFTSILPGAAE